MMSQRAMAFWNSVPKNAPLFTPSNISELGFNPELRLVQAISLPNNAF